MLKKRYQKSKGVCHEIIYIAPELEAEKGMLVGDFKEWTASATPMKPLEDGHFKVKVALAKDGCYQFR